jgi:hypothetical protein
VAVEGRMLHIQKGACLVTQMMAAGLLFWLCALRAINTNSFFPRGGSERIGSSAPPSRCALRRAAWTRSFLPRGECRVDLLEGDGLTGSLIARETSRAEQTVDLMYFDFSGTALSLGAQCTAMLSVDPLRQPSIFGIFDVYSGGQAYFFGQPQPTYDWFFRALSTGDLPPLVPTPSLSRQPNANADNNGRCDDSSTDSITAQKIAQRLIHLHFSDVSPAQSLSAEPSAS